MQNGETLLFNEKEIVWLTDFLDGEYIGNITHVRAKELLGQLLPFDDCYILKRSTDILGEKQFDAESSSKIIKVQSLSYSFFGKV